jgi:hypothetical protein
MEGPMARPRRKVHDERDAWALLGDWRESEQELPEFCAQRGIDGRSLNCWRRNLGVQRGNQEEPELRLVEVLGKQAVPSRRGVYRLSVEGVVIELDDDFHDDTLVRLLRVAAAC